MSCYICDDSIMMLVDYITHTEEEKHSSSIRWKNKDYSTGTQRKRVEKIRWRARKVEITTLLTLI